MASAARDIVFAAVPLTFGRSAALRYTGISERLFVQLERAGSPAFATVVPPNWGTQVFMIFDRCQGTERSTRQQLTTRLTRQRRGSPALLGRSTC